VAGQAHEKRLLLATTLNHVRGQKVGFGKTHSWPQAHAPSIIENADPNVWDSRRSSSADWTGASRSYLWDS